MRSAFLFTTAVMVVLSGPGFAQQAAPEGAQVDVQQAPPQVNIQQPAPDVSVQQRPPEVTVTQPEPQVNVQQAQPEITVQQQGEPQVNIERQGEPQITVRPPGQTTVNSQPQPEQPPAPEQGQQAQDQQSGQPAPAAGGVAAEQMIGKTVLGSDGEEVGEVEDLILNSQTNQIERAVIGVGGFLGIGKKQVAVDWSQIQPNPQGEDLTVSATKADLENMPNFEYGENENAMVGPR
jgi:sporulation protein YlmC with PRC-barrel domain